MYTGQSIPLNHDINSPFSLKNGIDQTTDICNIPESHYNINIAFCPKQVGVGIPESHWISTNICQIGNQAAKVPYDEPKGAVIFKLGVQICSLYV
jgi:hypothetical protein